MSQLRWAPAAGVALLGVGLALVLLRPADTVVDDPELPAAAREAPEVQTALPRFDALPAAPQPAPPPEPEPEVPAAVRDQADVEVRTVTAEGVQQALVSAMPAVHACMADLFSTDLPATDMTATVVVKDVGGVGRVTRVYKANTVREDGALLACLHRALDDEVFAVPARGEVSITLPLSLDAAPR